MPVQCTQRQSEDTATVPWSCSPPPIPRCVIFPKCTLFLLLLTLNLPDPLKLIVFLQNVHNSVQKRVLGVMMHSGQPHIPRALGRILSLLVLSLLIVT